MALSDKFEAYGKICWLWTSSDLHKTWTTTLQSRFILPAVERGQYHILEEQGMPVAYCSWAHMTLEAEAQYILDPSALQPDAWAGGDRLWFIDWISPFSARYTYALRNLMTERFADKVARSYSTRSGNQKARIATFIGKDLDGPTSRRIRKRYQEEVLDVLQNAPDRDQTFQLKERT
ncbi:MAG: toxin-activating lysine-acyltransferase [Pseudomonadota bacterium]